MPCPFFSSPKYALLVFLYLKMCPAHFSATKMHPACFYACICNTCTIHFTTKVKQPYITFLFNLKHYLELFTPALPPLEVCTGRKFQVRKFTNDPFNHLHIINENVFFRMICFYAIV